jgi:hypothetical protein
VVAFAGGAAATLVFGLVRELPPLLLGSLDVARAVALGGGAVVCLVLRLLALWYSWQLPRLV